MTRRDGTGRASAPAAAAPDEQHERAAAARPRCRRRARRSGPWPHRRRPRAGRSARAPPADAGSPAGRSTARCAPGRRSRAGWAGPWCRWADRWAPWRRARRRAAAGAVSAAAGAVSPSGGTAFTGAVFAGGRPSWPGRLRGRGLRRRGLLGHLVRRGGGRLLRRGRGLLDRLARRTVTGGLLGRRGDLLDGTGGRGGGRRRGRRAGRVTLRVALAELGGQLVGELAEQLVAHVGHHAAAELGRAAGDVEVGQHVDAGDGALGRQLRRHDGRGGAVAPLVLAARVDDGLVRGLVLLDEGGLALVGEVDRPELDLHPAGEVVPVDGVERGARHARGDPLDVEEHPPGLVDGHGHSERVLQLHG